MTAYEINFDGIVGPTHNYSGLSYGNVASKKSEKSISNPKAAALQGLEKMKFLLTMGIPQALLPPQERPFLPVLRSLGFQGDEKNVLQSVFHENPELLYACSSAACMWTANAATVSPSSDTADGRLHLTPANLSSKFHRSIEAPFTTQLFRKIFSDKQYFEVHDPLPSGQYFADEGAANHLRFCNNYAQPGVELFVWGRNGFKEHVPVPRRYPARQTYEASQTIARKHQLPTKQTLFAQQNPAAIDAGVFHNDVISVSNEYVYLCHEQAFVHTAEVLKELNKKMEGLITIPVPANQISLEQAVEFYLFNSQIVTLPNQKMRLIAPLECHEMPAVDQFLKEMIEDPSNPISGVDFLNLHQSMANGGGPACLRLRIVLNKQELAAMHQGILLTDDLYIKLKAWIEKHYRDRLHPQDLADIELLHETRQALNELTVLLNLGSIYAFQR